MKKIIYIVPYFGRLPDYFQLWLNTCSFNEKVNWLVITDDHSEFNVPTNVKVIYSEFKKIKKLIQERFDFKISLESSYKLVDYKIAYGEIFDEYTRGYDFWGFCDIDLMWGDIRYFINDEILENYDKIGIQGHSTIFKNNDKINSLYRHGEYNNITFKEVFESNKIFCSDREFIETIFLKNNKKIFRDTNYANLVVTKPGFFLRDMPSSDENNNYRQVFLWKNGKLFRYYKQGQEVVCKEFMYIHFFRRKMNNKIKTMSDPILIYPNTYLNFTEPVTIDVLNKYGWKSKISYIFRMAYQYKNKITMKRLVLMIESLLH